MWNRKLYEHAARAKAAQDGEINPKWLAYQKQQPGEIGELVRKSIREQDATNAVQNGA